jgi:hypothetical protein
VPTNAQSLLHASPGSSWLSSLRLRQNKKGRKSMNKRTINNKKKLSEAQKRAKQN